MSPELETLDQLMGGDLPLAIVRGFFDDDSRFTRALLAMLDAGEVRLLATDGTELPRWRWRQVLSAAVGETDNTGALLSVTEAGARRA
jgi:hypothetical protein